jgi:hypothetical protein
MAVQSKTLIGDVGSTVLAESVSQLNRAAGYISSPIGFTVPTGPNQLPNVDGNPNPLPTLNANCCFVIARFSEDVYVTNIEFGGGSAAGGTGSANSGLDRIGLVVGANPDGSNGTIVGGAVDFNFGAARWVSFIDAYLTFTILQARSLTGFGDAPLAVDAGNALALQFDSPAGSGLSGSTIETVTVTYRPVKDSLRVDPRYTKTLQNWKSVAR